MRRASPFRCDQGCTRREGFTRNEGFTLIEIMVVLAIIALTTTFITLGLNSARRDDNEIERLRLVLEAAMEQAQVQGTPLRFELLPQGYRFSRFDAFGNWKAVAGDALLNEQTLSPSLAWRGLEVDGQAIPPLLVLGASAPSFVLHIGTPSGNVELKSLPTGAVHREADVPAAAPAT